MRDVHANHNDLIGYLYEFFRIYESMCTRECGDGFYSLYYLVQVISHSEYLSSLNSVDVGKIVSNHVKISCALLSS